MWSVSLDCPFFLFYQMTCRTLASIVKFSNPKHSGTFLQLELGP